MADQKPGDGAGTSDSSGAGSDSFVMLNVKTLDSRIYSFHVEKDMPVTSFKQKIADQIGLPVAQQRLIFRGKVLKDETLLSEYHVETGDTLHLVERQLGQAQSSADPGSGEANANNNSQGNNPGAGATQNRTGQISHSVVLGTLNVGDFGESVVPEISRVIGAVLNSLGVNNQNAAMLGQNSVGLSAPGQMPPSNEAENRQASAGSQTQAGNPMQPGQLPSMLPFQLPFPGTSIPLPSLDTPIPDSLNTIVEFINRMEEVLSRNGNQPGQPASDSSSQPPVQLPSNAGGLPLPEALNIVLRRTERLLSGGATGSLSHIAGRLEQESSSTDSSVRSQMQSEVVQTGLVMQHLGALFLELGRTMLTVRMGQSPGEAAINSGPAVYISPMGPNPIMVQPSSLQVSPLFNSSGNSSAGTGPLGPIGIFGGAPRHVNIHIHAGATPVPIIAARAGAGSGGGEGAQAEHTGRTGHGDAASMRGVPMRNVIATAVSTRPTAVGISPAQPVMMVSGLQPSDSQHRNDANPRAGQQQSLSTGLERGSDIGARAGTSDPGIPSLQAQNPHHSTEASASNAINTVSGSAVTENKPDVSSNVPLGLGLGGLHTTRRTRVPQAAESSGPSGAPPSQSSNTLAAGQQILQSFASMRSSPANRSASNEPSPNPQVLSRGMSGMPPGTVPPSGQQFDMMGMMSQVLQNPAFNNLLSNIGGQGGPGGADDMRGMLQQFTQDPESMNTISQLAQQMGGQDLTNLLGGPRGGQAGGGLDLSGMIQQMMPLVTRALSGDAPVQAGGAGDVRGRSARIYQSAGEHDSSSEESSEIHVEEVIQRIAQQSPPRDVLSAMIHNAVHLVPGRDLGELVEICVDEELAIDFMEMLAQDLRRRGGGSTES